MDAALSLLRASPRNGSPPIAEQCSAVQPTNKNKIKIKMCPRVGNRPSCTDFLRVSMCFRSFVTLVNKVHVRSTLSRLSKRGRGIDIWPRKVSFHSSDIPNSLERFDRTIRSLLDLLLPHGIISSGYEVVQLLLCDPLRSVEGSCINERDKKRLNSPRIRLLSKRERGRKRGREAL